MKYKKFETDNAEYVLVYANLKDHVKHVECLEIDELGNLDGIVLEAMVEPSAELFETDEMPLEGSAGQRSPYELILNRIKKLAADEGAEVPIFLGDREIGANEKMIYGALGQVPQALMMLLMQTGIPRQLGYALIGYAAIKAVPSVGKWYLTNTEGETNSAIDNVIAIDNLIPFASPVGEMRYALLASKIEEYLVPEILQPKIDEAGEDRKPRIAIVYNASAASLRHNLQSEKRRNFALAPYKKLNWLGMHHTSLDAMVELIADADGEWMAKDYQTGVVTGKPTLIDYTAEEVKEISEEIVKDWDEFEDEPEMTIQPILNPEFPGEEHEEHDLSDDDENDDGELW